MESLEIKENQSKSFEEQFSKKEIFDVLDGEIEAVDLAPEHLKDEVPVLLAPGWGTSVESYKGSLETIYKNDRRAISLTHARTGIDQERIEAELREKYPEDELRKAIALSQLPEGEKTRKVGAELDEMVEAKLKERYRIDEVRKAISLLQLLEEKKIDQADAIAHSEGGDNISLAYELKPEKFRNLVFVGSAGLTGKDNFPSLAGRFGKETIQELKKLLMSKEEKERKRIGTVVKETLKYQAKNPARAAKEAVAISKIEIQEDIKHMHENGKGVGVIAGVDDKVFPMDRLQKMVKENQLDGFLSVKGGHNEIINHPEKYMASALELLDKLENKRKNKGL